MTTRARVTGAQPASYKYVYQKDQVIAIPPKQKGDAAKFYKITEDMRTNDERGRMKAVELKQVKNLKKEEAMFEETLECLVAVNSQILQVKDIERKKTHQKNAKMQFTMKNDVLENISKQIQASTKVTKKLTPMKAEKLILQDDSEVEDEVEVEVEQQKLDASENEQDEESNEDGSEEELKPKKASKGIKKQPPARKLPAIKAATSKGKSQNEDGEHSEEEEMQEKKKIVKKPRPSRAKKVINYEESSQQRSETEEASEQEAPLKRGSKVSSAGGGRKRPSRAKKTSDKYMKGKFNPNIQSVVTANPQLDSMQNDMLNLQAVNLNNKEFIRAAYTGNGKLLENILKSKQKISSFFERWAPERDFNAIELLVQRGNKTLLQKLLVAMSRKDKLKMTTTPLCSMKEINTGYNDKYAYGVRTRTVNLARGGREGNNALVQDVLNQNDWCEYMFDRLLETQTNPIMFNYIKSHVPAFAVSQLQARVPVAVRAGNYEVAGHLIQQMFKQGGMYGYNIVHAQVLTLKDPSAIGQVKKPSALKKTVGQMIITPVHCAAINPNPEFLRILLDISSEQSIMDEILRKPVHYAAVSQGTGTLKLLLERGVDPREGDRDKNTPLILASKFGRAHNIEVLHKGGFLDVAQVNFKNKLGNAAIHLASQGGHLECIKALVLAGANIHLTGKNRMTPLILASAYGHLDCVEFLLESGSKILAKDKMKRSSLIMAVRNGNVDIASLLLMRGAEFNGADSSKNSCVHYAAAYGFANCIDLLIKAGADQNIKNSWNLTPLSVALQKNLFGIVQTLLNYESTDVNCKDDEGRTLVSSSLSKFTADSFEYLKFLILEKNADVTIADLQGRTPLHYAAELKPSDASRFYTDWPQKSNEEKKEIVSAYRDLIFNLIDILISKGADINLQDNNGVTPFMTTIVVKNFTIANKLISLKSPNNELIDVQDQNILHLMAREKSFFDAEGIEMVRRLFHDLQNKKEMLAAVDTNGFTPLLLLTNQFAQGMKHQFQHILSELEQQEFVEKLHHIMDQEKKNRPLNVGKQKKSSKKQSKSKNQVDEEDSDFGKISEEEEEEEEVKNISGNLDDPESEVDQQEDDDVQVAAGLNQTTFGLMQPTMQGGSFPQATPSPFGLLPSQSFMGASFLQATPSPFGSFPSQPQPINGFGMLPPQPAYTQAFGQFQHPTRSKKSASAHVVPGFGGKGVFGQNNPYQPPVVNQYAKQQSFTVNNLAIIVGITLEEHKALTSHAQKQYDVLEARVFDLIQTFLEQGADGTAMVVKLKKYRYPSSTFEQEDTIQEQPISLRGGARIRSICQQPTSQIQSTMLAHKDDQYSIHGKQNILHFMFKYYPNQSAVARLLKLVKLDFNAQDYKGKTPLILFSETATDTVLVHIHENIALHQNSFLKYALNVLKVNLHQHDQENNTASSIVALKGEFAFLQELCKLGGNPNNLNKKNQVPLIEWVKQSNLFKATTLLGLGADPNFRDKQKRSSLHHAVNGSNSSADASFELEQLLLDNGARADILDKYNRTPIFYAFVKIGSPFDKTEIDPFETVSSLCALPDCSVDVLDKWKRTPLHYAAQRGSVISGRYLIKLDAKVDSWDEDNNTPIGIAFINGHSNFSTMMIDNKADIRQEANVIDHNKLLQDIKDKKAKKNETKSKVVRQKNEEDFNEEEDQEDEEDEDEDDDQVQNPFQQQQNYGFGRQSQPVFGGFGRPHQVQQQTFEAGKYSLFMLAIRHGWQGVAYLLITDGFDLQRAIEDALNASQFKLVKTLLSKVKDNSLITKLNSEKQNLFHILAIKGRNAIQNEAFQLIQEMLRRGIDCTLCDSKMRSPLHYACQYNFVELQNQLLFKRCDPNLYDVEQKTPFSLGIENHYDQFIQQARLSLFIQHGLDLNRQFQFKDKLTNILLFLIQEKNIVDEPVYHFLLENGADCNSKDQKGLGVLFHSIIINSTRLVNFFLNHHKFNKELHTHDNNGFTAIHFVVQPLTFGSYENIDLLNILIRSGMNLNDKDKTGKTPFDYANMQESGVMKKELQKHKALTTTGLIHAAPVNLIAQANWPEDEVDFETDSKRYLEIKEQELKNKIIKEEGAKNEHSVKVDQYCVQQNGKYEVVEDPEIGAYSLVMTKVDIKNGHYSENVYYRMQVIHEINRNVFVLFTRWGRIGTPGQFQMTPFENQVEAIKEFCKIFQSKAAHDWRKVNTGEIQFEKQKGRYQLMNIGRHQNYKQHLEPFDYSEKSPYPQSTLEGPIKYILQQFTQVKLYLQIIQEMNIDQDAMPLERLDRAQLMKAKSYLNEIQDQIGELAEVRAKKDQADIDIEEVLRIIEIIASKSSRFYELIPHIAFRNEPVPPIDNLHMLFQKFTLIETLLQFEVTSKILLGAHLLKQTLNPLNYCFNALNVRMMCLPREHPEFGLIKQYIMRSHVHDDLFIHNIFALERKGEAERFDAWKKIGNRTLLWHGSKVSNFMGILAQGLKVAPPWAFNTGAMFGKGIYFADQFEKSWAYTEDYSIHFNSYNGTYSQQHRERDMNEVGKYRYILLCEVALGQSKKLRQAENIESLPAQFKSVKGMGTHGPNPEQSIILHNGCIVPVGNIVTYEQKSKNPQHQSSLYNNEFIVYDETQVRIKYLLQCQA